MADHKKTITEQHKEQVEMWQELSKAHWTHWRAWGSWFSWGSPVGLGIFLLLLAIGFAVVKFAINL